MEHGNNIKVITAKGAWKTPPINDLANAIMHATYNKSPNILFWGSFLK